MLRLCLITSVVSCLMGGPSAAVPALDDLELKFQGEAKGWLNATCTYYGLGWLQQDDARSALDRLMRLIRAHQLNPDASNELKSAALERDPGCQAIWPSSQD